MGKQPSGGNFLHDHTHSHQSSLAAYISCTRKAHSNNLLSYPDKTLHLVHEKVRDGAVYQVAPFNGKLVATVNFEVQVLSWSEEKGTLEEECKYTNTILALFIKTKGDFILVSILCK